MVKTKILIIAIFLSFSSLLAQERYMVYFKDKGSNQHNSLNKSSAEYKKAEAALSERAIERRKKVMGENYITYEDLPISSEYIETIINFGVEIHRELKWFNAVSCYLTDEQINQIILLPFVEKIEKVRTLKRSIPKKEDGSNSQSFQNLNKSNKQNTFDYGQSFTQFNLIEVPPVHDAGINGSGVVIGLLDSGFRWKTHPAMMNLDVKAEYDFVYNDDNTDDEVTDSASQVSHGTAVLSVVGGFDEGNIVAPAYGASYILAKTEIPYNSNDNPVETNIEEDNFVAGVEWIESMGADIISTSLGYSEFDAGQNSYTYADMDGKTGKATKAYNFAFDRGVVTVSSAGNEGIYPWYHITTPADAFNVISVGGVSSSNNLVSFSSRGPTADGRIKPEVVAQAINVYTANHNKPDYKTTQGTSFAAPAVAGVAGMLLSAYPHLNNKQVRDIIIASGDNQSNPNYDIGYGLVSALRAINYPNIKFENNIYTLNKTFIEYNIHDPSTVMLHYSVNQNDTNTTALNYDDSLKYSYEINSIGEGDSIEFYFTFNNGTDLVRVPENGSYLLNVEDLSIKTVGIDGGSNEPVPSNFVLEQNYPNPFNPTTNIKYTVPEKSFISLKVFNMLGQEIKTLVNSEVNRGNYLITWNGTNNFGKQVSAGAYVYQMVAGNFVESKKLVYLK